MYFLFVYVWNKNKLDKLQHTRLAQLVERKALNLVVVGSSPTVGGEIFSKDKKRDNKGIRLIKQYVFKIYKLMKETLKETSSEDKQDA